MKHFCSNSDSLGCQLHGTPDTLSHLKTCSLSRRWFHSRNSLQSRRRFLEHEHRSVIGRLRSFTFAMAALPTSRGLATNDGQLAERHVM